MKLTGQTSEDIATKPNREIINEIYRAFVLLGAANDLLGTVGSWGDSLSESNVLSGLRAWNSATLADIKGRIGHYEMSCPHQGDSPDAAPERLLAAQ
jgi:hypothetical protein